MSEISQMILSGGLGLACGLVGAVGLMLRHRRHLSQQAEVQAELERQLALSVQELKHLEAVQVTLAEERRRRELAEREVALAQQRVAVESDHHQQQIAQLTQARQDMADRFAALSNQLLDRQTERIDQRHQEHLSNVLKPFADHLHRFEQRVQEVYHHEGRERLSLLEQIKHLSQQNEQMTKEAAALTHALTGQAKTRGDWGEVILERLLQASGLRAGEEYRTQVSNTDADGRRYQPDVVVDLPDQRCLIIDSKVSLVPWMTYCEASDKADRQRAGKDLVTSLRHHVRDLSGKKYQQLLEQKTLDFVLLFVPIEAAFSTVLSLDADLYTAALDRNVVIVSPTTLLATLKTVAMTWRSERQEQHAIRIAEEAGRMYDQLVRFTESMDEVDKRLAQARRSFDEALKRLATGRGNVIGRAEKVRDMGAQATRKLEARFCDELITE